VSRFAAIRRRRVTTGTAAVAVDGASPAAAAVRAQGAAPIAGSAAVAVFQHGYSVLSGEGSVFGAGAGVFAASTFTVDGTGRGAQSAPNTFPYTFPFVFGGVSAVEGETAGTAQFTLTSTAAAAAGADADAAFSIYGQGLTIPAGFPYTFTLTFAGTAPARFPYTLPIPF
jgi:hypothetical protein